MLDCVVGLTDPIGRCILFYMDQNLVARSKRPKIEVLETETGSLTTEVPLEEVKLAAAQLLAAGFDVKKVATSLSRYLNPNGNDRSAYTKLRRWMRKDQAFRDLIYEQAVVRLDLAAPSILTGVKNAAIRGRVDAARLALEITGRHTRDEAPITQVQVVLNNIPRPDREALT